MCQKEAGAGSDILPFYDVILHVNANVTTLWLYAPYIELVVCT